MHDRSLQSADSPRPATLVQERYVWVALVGWLILAVPLFIGMPLNSDTALYDVQARCVLHGGVAYRDIIEPNLPGALWIHMGIRSVAGWSSEVMQAADLLVLAAVLWLWAGAFERRNRSTPAFLLAVTFFYLTRNEWCHAQRDTWMLFPAGLAMAIRFRRPTASRSWLALLEGLCWGCAFWIKPHIAIPATTIMLVDLHGRPFKLGLRDAMVVAFGGVLSAISGVAWLTSSGAWEHFWQMMLDWNPEYVAAGRERMSVDRWVTMGQRFSPWLWVHLVAGPIALASLRWYWNTSHIDSTRRQTLLSCCYLAWVVQSVALQHALDYIHVPGIILGLAVICRHPWQLPVVVRRSVVLAFVVIGLLGTPLFRGQRLQQWPVVLVDGSTVPVRAALAHGNFPQWEHLGRVIEFLKKRGVTNGDVTCMNVHSIHVYNETGTDPATRYWSVSIMRDLFPQRAADITEVVANCQHRFVVTEARESELLQTTTRESWMERLTPVFNSGSYRVLEVGRSHGQVAQRAR